MTTSISMFLGESVDFWVALKARADDLNVSSLVRDIATLHAKVGYYEQRLDEMAKFRRAVDEN